MWASVLCPVCRQFTPALSDFCCARLLFHGIVFQSCLSDTVLGMDIIFGFELIESINWGKGVSASSLSSSSHFTVSISKSQMERKNWDTLTATPIIFSRISVPFTGSTVHITKYLLVCLYLFKFGFQKLVFVLKVNFWNNDWKLLSISYK